MRQMLMLMTSLVRKLDLWLLPFLSMMYFFNAIDRVSHTGTPKSDVDFAHH